MILLNIAVVFTILLFSFFRRKNLLFWSLGIYQIGSYVILLSLLVYNILVSIDYSIPAGIVEKFCYYIVLNLKLHITNIVSLYNFGNVLLLIAPVILLIVYDKRITAAKTLLLQPPIAYFIINHPRIKYLMWNYCMVKGLDSPFEELVILNSVVLVIYFLIPIVYLSIEIYRTKIFSKKNLALSTAVYVLLINLTMGFVLFSNPFSNYYPLRYTVNSMPIEPNSNQGTLAQFFSVHSKYTGIFLAVAVIVLIYIIIFCDFSLTFNIKFGKRKNTIERENDEALKTIFHTYKNAFFAIERFGSILESRIKTDDEMVSSALSNITSIAHTSYLNAKKMIDSVILSYDFSCEKTHLDVNSLLEDVLMQFEAVEGLTLEKNLCKNTVFVNGSHEGLSEVFTNIMNNAVEATEGRENPTVKVSLFSENNSAVINFYDNGCGIDKHRMKSIFQPLYSEKQSSNNFGIGLSTALKIVHYHSGTIMCKSKLNKYTVFQIILPTVK